MDINTPSVKMRTAFMWQGAAASTRTAEAQSGRPHAAALTSFFCSLDVATA
jgi:hypothetical protein